MVISGKVRLLAALHAILISERERWFLWLPVGLGTGIALYFGLPVEPGRWWGPAALSACLGGGLLLRRLPAAAVAAVAVGLVALGFTLAAERSRAVARPVLERPSGVIVLRGRIAEVEPLEQGLRVILDELEFSALPGDGAAPERVRLRLPQDEGAPRPGQRIAVRAELMPPPPPAAPGAYDFTRQAWFKGLGAVGFPAGPAQLLESADPQSWVERLRLAIANLRRDLTRRIVETVAAGGLAGGVGAVAAALVTGERGPVSPVVLQAYRDAGLAHVLVIAGMHMSMVAGLVFVALRGLLAAIPFIALRYPIKKWTAFGALLVTSGYLVISGAPVPTQRAFMMNGIVLLAVLIDRQAVSLRSITWAALVVLSLQPEALIGASFQMSFAAVYGLISGYEALGPRMARWRQSVGGWWKMPLFYLLAILLTTQIAGTATAYYTVYHFNRYATYSLLGNLLAVPIVGFWVMPAALLAFCLLPFGLDAWGWQLMGWGIVCIGQVAAWVSSLPGATLDLPAVPASSLVVFSLGGLWLCLWRTRWRLWGLAGLAAGLLLYTAHRPPDLLVSPGRLMAARGPDGTLALSTERGDKVWRESWSRQAGQGTSSPTWRQVAGEWIRCDRLGCLYRARGHLVAFARHPRALDEDCRTADLVIVGWTTRTACPSARWVIDAVDLKEKGTHAVWLDEDGGMRIDTVAEWQGDRPWSLSARGRGVGP